MKMKLINFSVTILSVVISVVLSYDIKLTMPGVIPETDDVYLCAGFPIPYLDRFSYIKSYESTTNSSVAHHILLYGCSKPFSTKPYYSCTQICAEGNEKIIFAWAKDAQKFEYPTDTGMAVAGNTGINYLILQVHYLKKLSSKDESGMKVELSLNPPTQLVSIGLLFSYYGDIPANTGHVNMDISCKFKGKEPAYPLAFRTHAHTLGRAISGFRVSHSNGKIDLIGKGNPQWPQTFYRANSDVIIMPGDILMARCVFDSTGRDRVTSIGGTHHDEMCNFYIMFVSKNNDGNLGFISCGGNEYEHLWKNVPSYSQEYGPPDPSKDLLLTSRSMKKLTFESQWEVRESIGEVSGVAILPKSVSRLNYSVLVLQRADRYWKENTFKENIYIGDKSLISVATIFEVDPITGSVLRKGGANNFILPHGITVTKDGKYVWVTDVALHQVMRFRLLNNDKHKLMDDKPDMIFGERFVLGNDKSHFCKPSKVAVDSKGYIFVADGYCNSRVLCFYPNGSYIDEWRTKDMMIVVHSITIVEDDSGDINNNLVWVTDRENQRLVAFKYDGSVEFISSSTQYKMPIYGIEFNPSNKFIYGITSNGLNDGSSFVFNYKLKEFKRPWHSNYNMQAPHDLCLAENGNVIFVAELHLKKVIKFSMADHSVQLFESVLDTYSSPRKLSSKLSITFIGITVLLTIFCLLFCVLLLCLFGRFSKHENKTKRYYPKTKDREGFEPLNQHEDDTGGISDPETEEFSAPTSRIAKKPKV